MTNAIVHRDDPISSYEAAEMHAAKRATNKRLVYRLVVRHPGSTAAELASETWLGVVEVRRRLTDLRADGMVYRGASRICREANNRQCEWWPAMRQGELRL